MYWWYPNHSVRDIASMVQWGRTQLGWLEHVTRHSPLQLGLENWKKQTYIEWLEEEKKEKETEQKKMCDKKSESKFRNSLLWGTFVGGIKKGLPRNEGKPGRHQSLTYTDYGVLNGQ